MLLKVLEFMVLLYYANAKQTVTISTNTDYYIPFQTVEINCTMSVYEDYGIAFSMASQQLCSIFRKNEACKIFVNNTVNLCQGECSCSLNGKSYSYVYNVTNDVDVLQFRCSVYSGNKTTREIKRGKEPENIEVSTSSPLEVVEGQNVGPITCSEACVPDCTFSWTSPDGLMTHGKIFQKIDVNRTDNGSYICTAQNVFGSKQETIDMIVQYYANAKQTVTVSTDRDYYIPFETVEINCTMSEYEDYGVSFSIETNILSTIFRKNGSCKIYLPHSPIATLCQHECSCSEDGKAFSYVYNVTKNDDVLIFRCSVLSGNAKSRKIKRAREPRNIEFNTSSPLEVAEGQNVGPISCSAACVPDCTFSWTSPDGLRTHGKIFQKIDVNRTDNGSYICTAEHLCGSKQGTVDIIVQYGPSKVKLNPSNQAYIEEEGNSLGYISCSSQCYPECTRIWTGPGINSSEKVLNLTTLNRRNSGQFVCTASNIVRTLQTTVNVTVQYVPTIRSIEGNTTYSENDTAEFRCHVDSSPKSVIKWKFKTGKNEHIYKVNGSLLTIFPISCLSMGLYTCEADNGISGTQKSLNVSVMCTPRLNKQEHDIKYMVHVVVRESAPLHLTAPILAYPEPWLYWEFQKNHNFTNITSEVTTHSVNRHTSSLVIHTVTEEDFGQYVLYGGNGIGNTTYRICSFQVEAARSHVTANTHSSSPSFAVGIGTGLGIAALIFVITLVIKAFIRIKRRRPPAQNNLYEETECKAGSANIYNELNERRKGSISNKIVGRIYMNTET